MATQRHKWEHVATEQTDYTLWLTDRCERCGCMRRAGYDETALMARRRVRTTRIAYALPGDDCYRARRPSGCVGLDD